jgi:hypothetical protein
MRRASIPVRMTLFAAAAVAAAAFLSFRPVEGGPTAPGRSVPASAVQARAEIPSEVVPYPGPPAGLAARWEWALGEAGKSRFGDGFWIGTSIKRLMRENSHIGTVDTDRQGLDLTIAEILSGKRNPDRAETDGEIVRRKAREILDELEGSKKEDVKVWKDLGLLYRYGGGRSPVLERVRMSNLDLAFDFDGLPLLWLGEASGEEIQGVIGGLYASAGSDKVREDLVAAAGVHGDAARSVPFLQKVLNGRDSDGVRKDAAFWLGQQHDQTALRALVRTAGSDASRSVRKSAVFAISQTDLPEAVDELITLARKSGENDVRREAVFWLGQIASKKAGAALEEFATEDDDVRIQEHAVFALSQLPDGGGVEPLIKIAKTHPDPRVRKKAVFWLGECRDPRALQTLIDIIKK